MELLKASLFTGKLELLRQSLVGRKIAELSNGVISKSTILKDKDWKSLENAIKGFYPEIYGFITKTIPHKSRDLIRLCLLSFFELSTKVEAFLLSKDTDAVRQDRTRLRRLFKIKSQKNFSYFQNYRDID